MRGVVSLVGAQIGLSVALVAGWAGLSGGLSVVPALAALLAGAAAWTAWVGGGLPRERVRGLAWGAGAGHGLLNAGLYAWGAFSFPEVFGPAGETPIFGAAVTGFLSLLCGMVLTLCGINAWNEPWGGLNGEG